MIHCTLMTQNENIRQHDITFQQILAQQQTTSVNMEELRGMLYIVKQQLAALLPLPHSEPVSSPLILVRIPLLASASPFIYRRLLKANQNCELGFCSSVR